MNKKKKITYERPRLVVVTFSAASGLLQSSVSFTGSSIIGGLGDSETNSDQGSTIGSLGDAEDI
jgi:hypothetical protein